jgi:hypothetical protein
MRPVPGAHALCGELGGLWPGGMAAQSLLQGRIQVIETGRARVVAGQPGEHRLIPVGVEDAMKGDAKPIPAAIRATSPTVRLKPASRLRAEQLHVLQFVNLACSGVNPPRRILTPACKIRAGCPAQSLASNISPPRSIEIQRSPSSLVSTMGVSQHAIYFAADPVGTGDVSPVRQRRRVCHGHLRVAFDSVVRPQ